MAARLHSWLAAQVRRGPAGLATGFVQSVLSTLAWLVQATERVSLQSIMRTNWNMKIN